MPRAGRLAPDERDLQREGLPSVEFADQAARQRALLVDLAGTPEDCEQIRLDAEPIGQLAKCADAKDVELVERQGQPRSSLEMADET